MKKKFVALLICAMFYPAVEAVKNAETANAVRNSAVNNTDTGIDPAKQPSAVNNTTPETAKYPSSANNTEEAVALAIELPTFAELHRPFGESDKLAFLSPAKKYYPQTWFHFIGGNVAKKGVTADLEAIAAAGISGVQFFHGQFGGTWPGMDNKQIACLSPQWEDILQYTAKEARRLGLNFTMQNCPGWSMSGGPWITPENSMRHLVFSRTDVEGDKLIDINLPKPQPSNEEWRDYKDVTVLAFPTPEDDTAEPLKISSVEGNGGYAWNACLDSFKTISLKPSSEEQPHVVEILFDEDKVVRTVEFSSVEGFNHAWCFVPGVKIKVEAVDEDGKTTEVLNTDMPQSAWQDGQPISLACNEKILDISPEETVDMIKTAGKKLLDMLSKVTTVLDYAIVADTDIFLGNDSMLSNIGFNMTLPDFDPSDNDAKAKRMEIVVQMRDMFEEKASKLSEALENATSTYIDLTGSDLPISFKWGGASKYRISIWNKHDMRLGYIKLYSGARHHNYETEAGWNLRSLLRADVKQSQSAYIPSEGVVDISAFMDKKNGNLKWDAPKGNWTIIRTGHINTGKRNGPAPPEGTGWECDKLAENGPNLQFANYIGRLADGALSGGLLGGMLLDSWECNTQTWTDNLDMEVEF
ncbi:MAG: hypothetical protein LBS80_04230, partial [Tannerella sp.]|nr:hypothetical protein [Tannerella sp.]